MADHMEPHAVAGVSDPFNDEPLPLFLTREFPEMERELIAMLRVIFGIYS